MVPSFKGFDSSSTSCTAVLDMVRAHCVGSAVGAVGSQQVAPR